MPTVGPIQQHHWGAVWGQVCGLVWQPLDPFSQTHVTPGSIRLEGSLVLSQHQITQWHQK